MTDVRRVSEKRIVMSLQPENYEDYGYDNVFSAIVRGRITRTIENKNNKKYIIIKIEDVEVKRDKIDLWDDPRFKKKFQYLKIRNPFVDPAYIDPLERCVTIGGVGGFLLKGIPEEERNICKPIVEGTISSHESKPNSGHFKYAVDPRHYLDDVAWMRISFYISLLTKKFPIRMLEIPEHEFLAIIDEKEYLNKFKDNDLGEYARKVESNINRTRIKYAKSGQDPIGVKLRITPIMLAKYLLMVSNSDIRAVRRNIINLIDEIGHDPSTIIFPAVVLLSNGIEVDDLKEELMSWIDFYGANIDWSYFNREGRIEANWSQILNLGLQLGLQLTAKHKEYFTQIKSIYEELSKRPFSAYEILKQGKEMEMKMFLEDPLIRAVNSTFELRRINDFEKKEVFMTIEFYSLEPIHEYFVRDYVLQHYELSDYIDNIPMAKSVPRWWILRENPYELAMKGRFNIKRGGKISFKKLLEIYKKEVVFT